MRRLALLLAFAATPLAAQQQQSSLPANFATSNARAVWMVPHNYVVAALEKTPDSLLTFKAAPEVRSLGQLYAHVADGEHLFCAMALGHPVPTTSVEKTKSTKAELLQALKESKAHCEQAYAQTDAQMQITANFFGNQVTRMWLLNMNAAHDYEHYGNIVTYMRIKKLVPPSSQQ